MSDADFQPPARSGAAVAIEESRALAEVKAAIFLARQFPRDEAHALQAILSDCGEVDLAEDATYAYARGGTDITGPSIRLAEAIARRWGNLELGVRELERDGGKSIALAFAWDLQANVKDSKQFEVPHVVDKRGGQRKILTDPRDIYERVANDGARRKRACILAIIPGHVVTKALDQCAATLRAKDPVTPEKLAKMAKAFADEFGVSKAQIEKRFQRHLDAITPAQYIMLRAIYKALKDGIAQPADHFEPESVEPAAPAESKVAEIKDKLGKQLAKTQTQSFVEQVVGRAEGGVIMAPESAFEPPVAVATPQERADAGLAPAPESAKEPAPQQEPESVAQEPAPAARTEAEENEYRGKLRAEIGAIWLGKDKERQAFLRQRYAKPTLVELNTVQLEEALTLSQEMAAPG